MPSISALSRAAQARRCRPPESSRVKRFPSVPIKPGIFDAITGTPLANASDKNV